MELIMCIVFRIGGGALIVFFQSLLITGAYGIILWNCSLASRSWRIAAFGLLFAAALGLNDWNVRPQAITFLLGALILLAINRLRSTQKKLWLGVFPFVMAIWVNSHGTFPIGLALIGAWWLDELWLAYCKQGKWQERLLLPTTAGVVAALACLLTPQGLGIVRYVRTMTVSPIIQNLVTEWAPPTFETLGGTIFLLGLIVSACVMALSPRRPTCFQITIFILFSLLGLKTMRGAIWFGVVMAPILAEHLKAIASSILAVKQENVTATGSRWLNGIFIFVLLSMAFFSLPWFKQYLPLPLLKAGIYSSETPIDATKFLLAEQLPNPLFNAMSFGSYLIWEAQPYYRVFVDPRIDLYNSTIILEYISVSSGRENWQEILDQYSVQTILASPIEQGGLIDVLDNSQEWNRIYTDNAAVIFIRE